MARLTINMGSRRETEKPASNEGLRIQVRGVIRMRPETR